MPIAVASGSTLDTAPPVPTASALRGGPVGVGATGALVHAARNATSAQVTSRGLPKPLRVPIIWLILVFIARSPQPRGGARSLQLAARRGGFAAAGRW